MKDYPMNNIPATISFGQNAVKEHIRQADYASIGVLVDENTKSLCYPKIASWLPGHELLEIKSGEVNKTLETCEKIWDDLTVNGFDRNSLLINLGGGVIGDMGGFCAATFKRGIAFINMPTTLLSQVDASVGGKLGIDFRGLKNHIGLFQDPKHIAIDPGFLSTLPENEMRSGFAEIIKHHLIRDANGWEALRQMDWPDMPWDVLIPHSVEIKSAVVASDPYESGMRKILNLGHTVGHAIESHLLKTNSAVLHGEAVAAGIICENQIAWKKNMLSEREKSEVERFILSLFGKICLPLEERDAIVRQAYQDKKNQNQRIRSVLLRKIGDPAWDIEITGTEILDALEYYDSL